MPTKRKPNQADRDAWSAAIRRRRGAKGLTQEQLAEVVGRSRRWIEALEQGTANPNWLDTIHFMAVLDIDPAKFAQEVGLHVPVSAR